MIMCMITTLLHQTMSADFTSVILEAKLYENPILIQNFKNTFSNIIANVVCSDYSDNKTMGIFVNNP